MHPSMEKTLVKSFVESLVESLVESYLPQIQPSAPSLMIEVQIMAAVCSVLDLHKLTVLNDSKACIDG